MNELDSYYAHLLRVGFIVLRQAADSGNTRWLHAELDLLHNVPSLIGERNAQRHEYFWRQERNGYRERIAKLGSADATSRMRTYYDPLWEEMASSIERVIAKQGGARTFPEAG